MKQYLLHISIFLAASTLSCSDGADVTQDLRSVADEAVNIESVGANRFEFGLTLPEGHDQLEGKAFEVPNYVELTSSQKISLICREGDRKEFGSRIIIMLREQSGDGTFKNESFSFQYNCANGALAKLSNLDPSYKYELRVLVLNAHGLIFKGQSESFHSSVGQLALKMKRVSTQDPDEVLVDIAFPPEPKAAAAEIRDAKIDCVFAELKSTGLDVVRGDGSCIAEPVKRVAIDSDVNITPPPSAECKGSGSCAMVVKIAYPEFYKVTVTNGSCSRIIYTKALPGESINVSACLNE